MSDSVDSIPFASRLTDILNSGALNLALGMGYSLGLFEAMDRLRVPATSGAIAVEAGLNERYVREWLAVMVCGDIVAIERDGSGTETFFLPREHGDLLCRRAGSSNLGVYTQEIPLLARCALDEVTHGFRTGEGVGYERYPKFHDFMNELAEAKHKEVLVDRFLPSVEIGAMTMRLNKGIRVCDFGCGRGTATLLMAEAFPNSRFTGIDFSDEAISEASRQSRELGLDNIKFLVLDAARLEKDSSAAGRFDYILAFDAIHDQTDPAGALRSAAHMLSPGGAFSMIDIAAQTSITGNRSHPMGTFLYTVSLMHCMPVGLKDGGTGLGMMWGRQQAEEMLREAGFRDVTVCEIPDDPFNLHFFCRREE
jgi:ubiquinone/menaquinone biosynthesis C-methylase UbiE